MGKTIRRVALIGETRAGKSTFAAANARGNVYAIDSDRSLHRMTSLIEGRLTSASVKGSLIPLDIFEEAEDAVLYGNGAIGTIIVDTVTKIYAQWARKASMLGRLKTSERVARGGSKNKASDMVDKANAIAVLAQLAAYGTDIFYLWHERESVDMNTFSAITKETISDVERQKLLASIDVVLRFRREQHNGEHRYTVYVDPETRDFGDQRANKDFTYVDPPDNYWRGAMDTLERLIYTSFSGPDEAIAWAVRELDHQDPAEVEDLYTQVKKRRQPKKAYQMWPHWIMAIDEWKARRAARQEEPAVSVSAPAPEPEAPEPLEPEALEPLEPEPESPAPAPMPAATSNGHLEFGNGKGVPDELAGYYQLYQEKFDRPPFDENTLKGSIAYHQEHGEWQ